MDEPSAKGFLVNDHWVETRELEVMMTMRVLLTIALGLLAVGATVTWATDWTVAGADGDSIGVLLMIAGGLGLVALLVLSAGQRAAEVESVAEEAGSRDESGDPLAAGRPRRRMSRHDYWD